MGEPNPSNAEQPEQKRRIPCDYPGCDKSFLRSEHLSRHQLNHYGRTLECDQCGKKFARSDLLHRHLDRHRHQAQKLHNSNPNSNAPQTQQLPRQVPAKPMSSPYPNSRPARSMSTNDIPRAFMREHTSAAPIVNHNPYMPGQQSHVQPILPAPPPHGPGGMHLQQCIAPMQSMVPGMPLAHEYSLPQPMFPSDMHQSHVNSLNAGIVMPSSPGNGPVFDINAKWDHLFQGGGIFDMSSVFTIDSEYGNLTPPELSVLENIPQPNISPYQSLISVLPTSNPGEFTLSQMAMDRVRNELPEPYRQLKYFTSASGLATLLEKAFFHLHNNYPIFHRPTLQLETFPTTLILAIASLGALLSDELETQQFGLSLHNYPILFSGNRDLWVLQTMLLINLTGNHLGKRLDHEMSDILQGVMITLARRNSVIFEDNAPVVGKQRNAPTDETKWHEWIKRESIKRFAHFIFINDTQHSCVFGHQGVMSVWEMKVTMPCSDALWIASNAQEWRRIMSEERKARSQEIQAATLLDIVMAFVSPSNRSATLDPRTVPLDALGLYSVLHGIFSVAWHHRHRKISPHWANAVQMKAEDGVAIEDTQWLLSGLHSWKSRYNIFWQTAHYPMGYQPPSGMWSPPFRVAAAAIYDLACIWLQAPIADIQMAAGLHFAHGRAAAKQRAQQSWSRVSKISLSDDVCHHGLNLVEAELLYKNESTGQPGLHSYLTDPSYPLFMPFLAYLGGLVLWTFALSFDAPNHGYQMNPRNVSDQASFHVEHYGMTEYPRTNPPISGTSHHFADGTDGTDIIRTLREHLSLSPGNADNPTAGVYSKSPPTTNAVVNAGSYAPIPDSPVRQSLFRQGIDILLNHLKFQLDGHRWEIATEGFEILHGTTNGAEYT